MSILNSFPISRRKGYRVREGGVEGEVEGEGGGTQAKPGVQTTQIPPPCQQLSHKLKPGSTARTLGTQPAAHRIATRTPFPPTAGRQSTSRGSRRGAARQGQGRLAAWLKWYTIQLVPYWYPIGCFPTVTWRSTCSRWLPCLPVPRLCHCHLPTVFPFGCLSASYSAPAPWHLTGCQTQEWQLLDRPHASTSAPEPCPARR